MANETIDIGVEAAPLAMPPTVGYVEIDGVEGRGPAGDRLLEAKALNQTPLSPDGIMRLGLGFWGSKAFLSAVELGLFTTLAKGPLDHDALREKLGLHERGSRDFFDALVALRMLDMRAGKYANTPETDIYLDRAKPSYIGGLLEMSNRRLYPFWGHLTEALRSGQPQNESKDGGPNPFAAMYADPVNLEGFLKAMTGVSLPTARAIATAFPWANYKTFADIGCAQGGLMVEVAAAHPHLSGIGFDLPAVQPVFEQYVKERGLAGRLAFQPGNFFEDALPKTEVLVMGHILHDWNLVQKQMLLGKAHAALGDGGTLIVYDAMIDDGRRENAFGLLMSLNMLIETPGGFDYTGADCLGWMRNAGFREVRVQHLQGPYSMALATK
jgi:O-methyltransferase domain/Dimerisation domain